MPASASGPSDIQHLAIIAGGKGTRLAGVAGDLPKVLVPVGGKPVLQHQLELAAAAGIGSVSIFAGYLAEAIREFVGDGSRFGLKAQVYVEDEPLGNAGALIGALDEMPEQFFVVYGDVMLAADLAAMARFHLEKEADFTAFVHPNDHPYDSDIIEASGGMAGLPQSTLIPTLRRPSTPTGSMPHSMPCAAMPCVALRRALAISPSISCRT